jgi:hypothetical protein
VHGVTVHHRSADTADRRRRCAAGASNWDCRWKLVRSAIRFATHAALSTHNWFVHQGCNRNPIAPLTPAVCDCATMSSGPQPAVRTWIRHDVSQCGFSSRSRTTRDGWALQECFKANWTEHKRLHKLVQAATVANCVEGYEPGEFPPPCTTQRSFHTVHSAPPWSNLSPDAVSVSGMAAPPRASYHGGA